MQGLSLDNISQVADNIPVRENDKKNARFLKGGEALYNVHKKQKISFIQRSKISQKNQKN